MKGDKNKQTNKQTKYNDKQLCLTLVFLCIISCFSLHSEPKQTIKDSSGAVQKARTPQLFPSAVSHPGPLSYNVCLLMEKLLNSK